MSSVPSVTAVFAATATTMALLLVPGTASAAPRESGAAGAPPVRAAAVTLRADRSTVEPGQRVRLTGRARAPRGAKVKIQVKAPGRTKWRTPARVRVRAQGRFRRVVKVRAVGTHRFRACVARPRGRCSRPVRVEVRPPTTQAPGWYYLHDGGPVAEAAGDWCPIKTDRPVAGIADPRSIGFGWGCKDDNEAEVSLLGRCESFEARIGLSDLATDTTPDVRYAVRILVDGVERFHQPVIAPGQAWDVSIDLTGGQRLRFEVPFVSGTHGLVVLGGARVHCAL